MEFTSVRNPVYISPETDNPRLINCEVQWNGAWHWFTANPNDTEQHGRDLHAALLAGDHGTIAAYVPPTD